jgi:trans-aconitate methyltransferase
VCDLACGTGNAATTLLEGYPDARVTLVDEDPDLLSQAHAKAEQITPEVEPIRARIETDGEPLPGGPYDVVLASLALHAIVGHDTDPTEAESRYELLFHSIRSSLTSGGHVLVGDHTGTLPLYTHLQTLDRAGFTDVDCAWRQDDFFVAGGVAE